MINKKQKYQYVDVIEAKMRIDDRTSKGMGQDSLRSGIARLSRTVRSPC
jgi:hypothetical protein